MHIFIFYASYIVIPFFVFLIFFIIRRRKLLCGNKTALIAVLLLFLGTLLFIYSRFIERNIILTRVTKVETEFFAKIVVVSDLHLGDYKGPDFLRKIVSEINAMENVDAVLMPGDFVYCSSEDLEGLFSPLKDIKFPVYAVLGNHDRKKSDPFFRVKLQKALEDNHVFFLYNSSAVIKHKNIIILGLGDRLSNQDDVSKINEFKKSDNLIVLAHNPGTTLAYRNSIPDITITGHTHGGQIRIPYLYKQVIPCDGNFDQGLYNTNYGKVFVSAGLGEIGLPMRLGVPPTIEVLELN